MRLLTSVVYDLSMSTYNFITQELSVFSKIHRHSLPGRVVKLSDFVTTLYREHLTALASVNLGPSTDTSQNLAGVPGGVCLR